MPDAHGEESPAAVAGRAATVEVLRSPPEIEKLRSLWTAWPGHRDSDIDFYLTSLRSSPDVVRPHVMVLCREGRPDAMLVGRIERSRVEFTLGYFNYFRPRVCLLTFSSGALRGNASTENCRLLIDETRKALRRGEADGAMLSHLSSDAPLGQFARNSTGWFTRDHFSRLRTHWSMTLPDSPQEMRHLSRKVRHNQRWRARKVMRDHDSEMRIQCYREPAELERMIQDVEAVARKTYQRSLGVGFTDNAETRARLLLEAERGWLRAYVLYMDDQPWSFLIACLHDGTLFFDFTGYDSRYGKYGPGSFLVTHIIEDCCNVGPANPVKRIDFGPGDQQWKALFANHNWQEGPIHIFAPTLRGLWFNAVWTSSTFVEHFLKKVLVRVNLLPRIKRLWLERIAER